MTRVLSVSWGFSFGGVSKYMEMLEMAADDHLSISSMVIVSDKRVVDWATLAKLNAVVVRMKGAFDVRWLLSVVRQIRRLRPDVIVSHGFNAHVLCLLLYGVAIIRPMRAMTYHGEYHGLEQASRWRPRIFNAITYAYAKRVPKGILAVAAYCKQQLVAKGVEASTIEVVYNGIERHAGSDGICVRREFGFPAEATVFCAASRLDAVKGVSFLLRAFAKVAMLDKNAYLLIVGDGAERNSLEELSKNLGMNERIVFAGMRNDVRSILDDISVFVLPSLAEYHSIALLEAMSAERPIVATDVGGNAESVRHELEALLVQPGDSDALADQMIRMTLDDGLRVRLSSSAKRRFDDLFHSQVTIRRTRGWLLSLQPKGAA